MGSRRADRRYLGGGDTPHARLQAWMDELPAPARDDLRAVFRSGAKIMRELSDNSRALSDSNRTLAAELENVSGQIGPHLPQDRIRGPQNEPGDDVDWSAAAEFDI